MALHFPAELPVDCIRELVTAIRAGDFHSPETVDHALYALGCANAFRGGPQPFGDGLDDSPVADVATASDEELADGLEQGIAPRGDEDAKAIPAWLLPILLEVGRRLFDRWLNRK